MGRQQKLKAQRRAERQAVTAPSLSWQDEEGIHFVAPGTPPLEFKEKRPGYSTKNTRNFVKVFLSKCRQTSVATFVNHIFRTWKAVKDFYYNFPNSRCYSSPPWCSVYLNVRHLMSTN